MKGLATATLSLALAGCGVVKKGSSCDLKAKNLRAEPWTGAGLPANTLSLTFLRGPSETTADIGDLLEQRGIFASFFVKGAAVAGHGADVHHLWKQGHLVGNGSYTFTPLTRSKEPTVEVRKTDALITGDVTGNMFLLHAPEGEFNKGLADLLNQNGLGKYVGPIVPDTVPSETFMDDKTCWENDVSVSVCAQQYFTEIVRLQKGIIPFHDEDARTLELLASLLPDLSAFGFSFVRLDQVPELRSALAEAGSTVDIVAESSCDDYE
jgi:peptidoglycan/xylan/chitin deacetylase (PgdA/CDA1 family)